MHALSPYEVKALNQLLAHFAAGAERPDYMERQTLRELFAKPDPLMPRWQSIIETDRMTLPPNPEGFMSETVWLALSDGTVRKGQYLGRQPTHEFPGYVHDWFIERDGEIGASINCEEFHGARVEAWAPIAVPFHPAYR